MDGGLQMCNIPHQIPLYIFLWYFHGVHQLLPNMVGQDPHNALNHWEEQQEDILIKNAHILQDISQCNDSQANET